MGAFLKASFIIAVIASLGGTHLDRILDEAQDAADKANIVQLSTALELYHLDHDAYPRASSGPQLIALLERGSYIKTRPTDPSAFRYADVPEQDTYLLTLR